MNISHRHMLVNFIRFFLISWLILVIFISMIDLLGSFISYLNYGLKLQQIFMASVYHVPTIASFTMAFAVLFSSAYLFGKMMNDGEMLGFMTLGYSFFRMIIPQILLSLFLCLFNFAFTETVAIPNINKRYKILEYVKRKERPSFIVFKGTKSIFYAEKYIESESQFQDVTIIMFDENGKFLQRVDANDGNWTGENWLLTNVRILNIDKKIDAVYISDMIWDGQPTLNDINLSVKPQYDATLIEAYQKIALLKKNGMPYRSELLNFLRRFSQPFAVILYAFIPLVLQLRRGAGVLYSGMIHFAVVCIFIILNMIFGIWARNGSISTVYAVTLPLFIMLLSIFGAYTYRELIDIQLTLFKRYREFFRLIKVSIIS